MEEIVDSILEKVDEIELRLLEVIRRSERIVDILLEARELHNISKIAKELEASQDNFEDAQEEPEEKEEPEQQPTQESEDMFQEFEIPSAQPCKHSTPKKDEN